MIIWLLTSFYYIHVPHIFPDKIDRSHSQKNAPTILAYKLSGKHDLHWYMFAQWIRVLWSVLTNLLMCNTMFKWVWLEYFNTVQRRLPAHWTRRGRLMLSPTQFVSKKQLEPYPIGVFIAFMWLRNHFSFQHLTLLLIYYLCHNFLWTWHLIVFTCALKALAETT